MKPVNNDVGSKNRYAIGLEVIAIELPHIHIEIIEEVEFHSNKDGSEGFWRYKLKNLDYWFDENSIKKA